MTLLFFPMLYLACSVAGQATKKMPPGQTAIEDFPLLHIGPVPDLTRENWKLRITGILGDTITMDWNAFIALDTVSIITNFHCVTGWSRFDNRWTGILIRTLLQEFQWPDSMQFITFLAADGYSTSLPIAECMGDKDILAFQWENQELTRELGGPVRIIVPGKYGYKNTMWLTELRFSSAQEEGYWEKRGYHQNADPFREERYQSGDNVPSHR